MPEATERGTDRAQAIRAELLANQLLLDPNAIEADAMMVAGYRFEPMDELAHNLVEQLIRQARTIRDLNEQAEAQRQTIVRMDRGLIRRDRLLKRLNHAVAEAETHPEASPPTMADVFGPWWREVYQHAIQAI